MNNRTKGFIKNVLTVLFFVGLLSAIIGLLFWSSVSTNRDEERNFRKCVGYDVPAEVCYDWFD